ncbi:MAG: biotin--[Clostridia bacterium]|nr:biotin--[acetyl-CoA-carboxylase] ligase [Clostridia bacterium]
MQNNKDILSALDISRFTKNSFPADRIFALKTVNSTNFYAKNLALRHINQHETVVISDTQTDGRGRLGREFFSPPESGIYMSIILTPENIVLPPSHLTVAAGVAVCRVLKDICPGAPSIKWVNDIFLEGKKVCGILAEGIWTPNTNLQKDIIVGIGLNVFTKSEVFPGKLNKIAGSIFPQGITRNEIIAKILMQFRSLYQSASVSSLIDEYKSYSLILGKHIVFSVGDKSFKGIAKDINNDGNLVVLLDSGKEMTLNSGEVSLGSSNFLD